jgi:hypothetical protein
MKFMILQFIISSDFHQVHDSRLESWTWWKSWTRARAFNPRFEQGWTQGLGVKVLKTVTVWVQIYTYRSTNWSMILQSSIFILLYNFDLIEIRVSLNYIMISFFYHRDYMIWLISFSSIDLINFRENHVIFVIFELNYSWIVNDSLIFIRRTW